MTTRTLVDRQTAPLLDMFPLIDLASAPIAELREQAGRAYAIMPPPAILPEEVMVPSTRFWALPSPTAATPG